MEEQMEWERALANRIMQEHAQMPFGDFSGTYEAGKAIGFQLGELKERGRIIKMLKEEISALNDLQESEEYLEGIAHAGHLISTDLHSRNLQEVLLGDEE